LRSGRARSPPQGRTRVYDFIKELYLRKRVGDRTYARLHALLGDEGMVEFVGILGYYVLIAMSLKRVPDGNRGGGAARVSRRLEQAPAIL